MINVINIFIWINLNFLITEFDENYEFVDERNIQDYCFSDIVIPIIGAQAKYPKNKTFDLIDIILKENELSVNDLSYKESHSNAKGHYRKFVQIPEKLEYEFIKHDDPDEDLTTDNYNVEIHPKRNGDIYNSVRLTFQLPQSTYATMLFRELSKLSSDIKFQAELSEKNKEMEKENNLIN